VSIRRTAGIAGLLVLVCAGLRAQSAEEEVHLGVEARAARTPEIALQHFQRALALDSGNYQAQWRAAEVLMDIGKQTPDSVKSPERDSVYSEAERYARRATELAPDSADGHYALAAAIGRASLTKSKKERVRRASEIRAEALRALEIDPHHDKADHVLGRWNAEIMRLSGLTRFFAKTFLGGKIFNAASWDSAEVYMVRAVDLVPASIYHRLDLAEILIDRGRYAEARDQLSRVESLPIDDVMDPAYQARAQALVTKIAGKSDKGR
jgi:tetratricopeptide (TPR) repeat protein